MPIGQFSERSGLSPRRLRTYAAAGLLTPAAVDSATGYRYYSPGQLGPAQVVETLRRAGVPLVEIPGILRDPSCGRLDDWAQRMTTEAAERRRALDEARRLLTDGVPPEPGTRPGGEPMTRLNAASRTECGPVRENNEDSVVGTTRLAAVADGMGGPPGGEIASAMTVGLIEAAFSGRSLDELEAGVRAANRAVWERALAGPGLEGMGTTVCAAGLEGDGRIAIVNVGDSRAFLWRDGKLAQLTRDHSLIAELVRQGQLSEEEALRHPQRGILTRALGVGPNVELDSSVHPVMDGDRLLLCTDGLLTEVGHREMASVMEGGGAVQAVADGLAELALSRGARDNVSVVVAEVSG